MFLAPASFESRIHTNTQIFEVLTTADTSSRLPSLCYILRGLVTRLRSVRVRQACPSGNLTRRDRGREQRWLKPSSLLLPKPRIGGARWSWEVPGSKVHPQQLLYGLEGTRRRLAGCGFKGCYACWVQRTWDEDLFTRAALDTCTRIWGSRGPIALFFWTSESALGNAAPWVFRARSFRC